MCFCLVCIESAGAAVLLMSVVEESFVLMISSIESAGAADVVGSFVNVSR